MPWDTFKLNNGNIIPGIAYGTGKCGKGQGAVDQVDQAISVGFNHIDTAQSYRNEVEAGIAIRESGLARTDLFVTTKFSGLNGLDIPGAIRASLQNLGLTYVDLYLIHFPRLAVPDIPTAWAQMEDLQRAGLAKSIGVSNFEVKDLEILLASAKIKPVVNQILLHPYVWAQQQPIIEFGAKYGIVTEAYSVLIPIIELPGGPLDQPLYNIAEKRAVSADQILLAWVKAKGVVVISTSSRRSRLEGYIHAGDIDLSEQEIKALDEAGAKYSALSFSIVRLWPAFLPTPSPKTREMVKSIMYYLATLVVLSIVGLVTMCIIL